MNPLMALLVGANLAVTISSSKYSAKAEEAQISSNLAQERLRASESAYERTKSYRESLSTNLALAGMGKGGVSGFRGVAAESGAALQQDLAAIGQQTLFAEITAQSNRSLVKAKRLERTMSGLSDAASLAKDLGLFAKKSK